MLPRKRERFNKDITLSEIIRTEIKEIDLTLENTLKNYGNNIYDKNILPIFALYDDRQKFCLIRAKVRGLKGRIESGKEAPIMRRILSKIVRSKEKFVEDVQEMGTMTPTSSSSEDDSDIENQLFSNFSFKPRSSNGRRARTLQEQSFFSSKPRSSNGRGVRTLQEQSFSLKPRSSNGRGARTLQEQLFYLTATPPSSSTEDESEFPKPWLCGCGWGWGGVWGVFTSEIF